MKTAQLAILQSSVPYLWWMHPDHSLGQWSMWWVQLVLLDFS